LGLPSHVGWIRPNPQNKKIKNKKIKK